MALKALAARLRGHPDAGLTAAALVVALSIGLPKGQWSADTNWDLLLEFLAWLPLTLRMRWPVPVAVAAVAIDAVHVAVAGHEHTSTTIVPIATMLALYTIGTRYSALPAWCTAVGVGALQLVVAELVLPTRASFLIYLNWPVVATALGRLVQERRERIAAAEQRAEAAERSKQSEARRQVTAERLRIARDLHDVLAHHITVVNAQAGVAQYLLKSDPAAAEKALSGIADNTRAALDELRATLGLLRAESDDGTEQDAGNPRAPALGAAQFPALVERFAEAGVAVRLEVSGTVRALGGPADLALYRIAQEALTNASKHARGSAVTITVSWGEETVTLIVANGPAADAAAGGSIDPTGDGTGHGLLGMRERALSAGGRVDAGPVSLGAASGYGPNCRFPLLSLIFRTDRRTPATPPL